MTTRQIRFYFRNWHLLKGNHRFSVPSLKHLNPSNTMTLLFLLFLGFSTSICFFHIGSDLGHHITSYNLFLVVCRHSASDDCNEYVMTPQYLSAMWPSLLPSTFLQAPQMDQVKILIHILLFPVSSPAFIYLSEWHIHLDSQTVKLEIRGHPQLLFLPDISSLSVMSYSM